MLPTHGRWKHNGLLLIDVFKWSAEASGSALNDCHYKVDIGYLQIPFNTYHSKDVWYQLLHMVFICTCTWFHFSLPWMFPIFFIAAYCFNVHPELTSFHATSITLSWKYLYTFVLHIQLTKIIFVLDSWHLLSRLLHYVYVLPHLPQWNRICLHKSQLWGNLEIMLSQTDSPWKYCSLHLFGLNKIKANCESNLLLMNSAAQIKQLRPHPIQIMVLVMFRPF